MPGSRGVGLYFDDAKVYAVELHKEFGETQIVRSAEADVPAAAAGLKPPAAAYAAAARQALEKARISPQDVILAVPEKEVMVRYFEMPLVPRKEWANAVRFEAQKYVPFDVRDLYFDYDLFVDRIHKKIGVAFVAAKKKDIDELAEAMRAEGVPPAGIETASIALVRALHSDGREVRALVHRDRDGAATVVIFRHRSVLMSRTGPARSNRLEDADRPVEELFVAEIRLAFNYFSKNFKNEVIKRIFVSADASDGRDWTGLLGREFGLPSQSASSVSPVGRGKTLSPGMNVAVGLALREVRHDAGKKVNLLPRERPKAGDEAAAMAPEEEQALIKKWAVRELVAAALVIASLHIFFSARVSAEKKALAAARILPHKSETSSTAMRPEALKAKLAELEEKEAFLTNFMLERSSVTAKLDEIAKTIPDALRVTSLSYSDTEDKEGRSSVSLRIDGSIHMEGGGSELAMANEFVNALKANERFRHGFGEIKLTQVKKAVGTVPGFFAVDCSGVERGNS